MKGKKKPKAPKTDKPQRTRPDFNNRGGVPQRGNPTRPNMDFSMGGLPNKQPPKLSSNLNMPGQFRPQPMGGNLGNVPPPSMNAPSMRPPQGYPPANLPPGMIPPSNLPPGMGLPPNVPPSNLPPMGSSANYKPQTFPQNPIGVPPQGNIPPRMNPPVPGGQFPPTMQAPIPKPQGQRPPE